jgi:hypothetical protein
LKDDQSGARPNISTALLAECCSTQTSGHSCQRSGTAGRALTDYLLAAREAIEEGTFEARDDSHLTWTTVRVDERGWCKGSAIVAEALDKLLALEEECAPRIEAGAEQLDATYGLGFFESPRRDIGDDD